MNLKSIALILAQVLATTIQPAHAGLAFDARSGPDTATLVRAASCPGS